MTKQRTPENYYAESGLDRAAHRREPEDWFERLIEAGAARLVPVWRSKHLIAGMEGDHTKTGVAAIMERPGGNPQAIYFDTEDARALLKHVGAQSGDQKGERVFLGERDGIAYVALDISDLDEEALPVPLTERGVFADLRMVGPVLDRADGAVFAYARGMLTWHRRHLYCGICGAPTQTRSAGHVRSCTNEDCGVSHFPRTDPAVIMLVTDGERALLGRQAVWPTGMHSTLAGFVEPGETLEAAVAREVFEEAGVRVENVRYHSSQPWPFPSSIMLGFYADAVTTEITTNDSELESAAWFERDWLKTNDGIEGFRLPRLDSISRRLIDDWISGEVD
ncbi:MAG: NAD(+) diphosphatase [Alphaproteobacteria bacterium]|nr:NAD(+) diphosphatase [Alphaproteobacteria bacterium]